RDVADPAVVADVREELPSRELPALPHDGRDAPVREIDLVHDAALAAEAKADTAGRDRRVAPAERREPVGSVRARILLVPDPHPRLVEQADDGGDDLHPREPLAREVRGHAAPDRRQAAAEGREALELVRVAHAAPLRMIAVLLPAACVVPGRLQVAVGALAD